MYRQKVTSSNVAAVGYDEMSQTLEVEFKNSDVYQYFKVPENIYVSLMTSPSIGQAVHKLLRGKFEDKKV